MQEKELHILISHLLNFTYSTTKQYNYRMYTQLYSYFYKYINHQIPRDEILMFLHQEFNSIDPLLELDGILQCAYQMPNNYNELFNIKNPHTQKRSPNSHWSHSEDQRLIYAVCTFTENRWKDIAAFMGPKRSRGSLSQRWYRVLNPFISKCAWSQEEDAKLLELAQRHGTKSWVRIAQEFQNRTDVQCRYRYNQINSMKKEKDLSSPDENSLNITDILNDDPPTSIPKYEASPSKEMSVDNIIQKDGEHTDNTNHLIKGGISGMLSNIYPNYQTSNDFENINEWSEIPKLTINKYGWKGYNTQNHIVKS